jgi:hypothetical protein
MSEKLLRFFLLSEIRTIRLVCKNEGCGAISEVPIEKLEQDKWKTCRGCERPFGVTDKHAQLNWLQQFSQAVAGLREAAENLEVEFVLPAQEIYKLDRTD